MTHKHSVRDTGTHYKIDQYTRQIKNDSAEKATIVQYDHNSERLTFSMPLYVDGHAMTLCDLIEVHYINIATDGKTQHDGTYEVDDIKADGENAVFTWLVSQEATQLVGSLNFLIVFKCTENGVTTYRWSTTIYKNLAISDGMDNGESVLTEYPDILAQWKTQLFDASETAVVNVANAEANALANIEAAGEAKKQSVLDSIPDEYEALSDLCDNNYRNKAGAIVVDAEGENIVLNDVSNYPLQNLKLFGKSTQDGTPTPDVPVDIISVENPTVSTYGKNLAYSKGGKDVEYEGLHIVITKGLSEVFLHGTTTKSFGYAMMDGTYLVPGVYTMSVYGLNSVSPKYDQAYLLDLATRETICSEVKSDVPVTFTVTHAGDYRVDFLFAEGTKYDNTIVRVQIEAHDEATKYESYIEPQNIILNHNLHGIPVSSGGNYTDADGQQWICDEVDLARGVYVKRTKLIELKNINTWRTWGVNYITEGNTGFYAYDNSLGTVSDAALCTFLPYNLFSYGGQVVGVKSTPNGEQYFVVAVKNDILANTSTSENAIASFKEWLQARDEKLLVTIKPIETPLSDAEINAFRALHTNKPNTAILNDAGAYMVVEYIADTKTYIDNKIAELG